MTSGDGVKLLRTLENEEEVYIGKLVVAISPAGVFLQKISHLVTYVTYTDYQEPTFNLPEGNTISEIQIMHATSLRAFVAGPSTRLESLNIQQCILSTLIIWHQLEINMCEEACNSRTFRGCIIDVINMTSGDGVKLLRTLENEELVYIGKLVVAISPAGVFLQKISHLVTYMHACIDDCTSRQIHDCEIDIINMTSGGAVKLLRLLENESNVQINKLVIAISPSGVFLQKISHLVAYLMYNNYREPTFNLPEGNTISEIQIMRASGLRAFTLPKMTVLKQLCITNCMLSVLRLDMLVENQNLTTLDLSYNQIRQIFPVTGGPDRTLSIDSLMLTDNLLEHLDMTVFMPFLPKLLPELYYLSINGNNISHLDLSYFRPYRKLEEIYLTSNQISTVRTSTPVRLPIESLDLQNNRIILFNMTGCDLPNMTSLDLGEFACWILLIWYQLEKHLCDGQCIKRFLSYCDVGVINMTSDGRVKLMGLIDQAPVVRVEKMIVAISPTGPFLQTISPFIDSIAYGNYQDPTFVVPEGNTISEISFMRATSLRAFIAGPNTFLAYLNVEYSALDRLPQTLPKLDRLKKLTIKYGMLSILRLDMLVENQNLTTLDLSYNQIRQIFPLTAYPGRTLSIDKLILNGNQLERLDMSVFASMSKLDYFYVLENRLTQLDASIPTTFSKLSTFYIGGNKIRTLDLRNLTLPSLLTVSLGPNNLKQMPSLPKALPALEYMSLEKNNLTQLNLSYFRKYQTLKYVFITSNQITAVRTSSPVKLSFVRFGLLDNKINLLNLTGCSFPNMTSLNLRKNHLTVVPAVFERFPKLTVTLDMNPITCDTLLLYKEQIKNDKLYKDRVSPAWPCSTTSSFLVGEKIKICCDS
ncbi:toll-like receptor 13 [Anopheles moucheti]|uniref:toll-like receptor 13 n=1 Tax=Anopheles moucheti TaxID=186751 RepID=UPI0022F076E9|nr:toll-like receptor 13 [Anopheles moucheti]